MFFLNVLAFLVIAGFVLALLGSIFEAIVTLCAALITGLAAAIKAIAMIPVHVLAWLAQRFTWAHTLQQGIIRACRWTAKALAITAKWAAAIAAFVAVPVWLMWYGHFIMSTIVIFGGLILFIERKYRHVRRKA
ncbi:hypothetical protein ACXU4B_11035 [Dyella soli]|uniref:Uncharacterized protein n=1 Tax=Dyella soli TaxID=522319 RepID=A0A4R0YGC9_9GAMM|nr:hypothetical protein [Dyella soli]TCI07296.1 hypothetical protein EZM97_32385 [Dyella soli]